MRLPVVSATTHMQLSRVRIRCLLPALALMAAMYGHAQDAGTVTLLKDTPLRVIRGVSVLQGVEGMRLRAGDFLQTGPAATAQAQLEFPGAIVELGPSTQIFVDRLGAAGTEIVVAAGWLKEETTSGSFRFDSPLASVTTQRGSVLLHSSENGADIFIERGAAQVIAGGSAPIGSSAEKIFFTRRGGKPVTAAGRPSPEFVDAMPVAFRDVLPPRLDRFAGKKAPEPRSDHEVSYSDFERLLSLPAQWRKGLVERFKPRLRDRAFRQGIEAHIAELPEWKAALAAENQNPGAAPVN